MRRDWKRYFVPETLEQLAGLGLRRSQPFDGGLLAGTHRSPRHGHSVEFAEHRPYVPGDDLRNVDWKIFGRTDRYFLRHREDETTLVCHLMIDTSGSMAFRGIDASAEAISKFDYACQVAASLAYLTVETQDVCSLTCLGAPQWGLPVGGGQRQLEGLVEMFSRAEAEGPKRIGRDVEVSLAQLRRSGMVVLISDLWDDLETLVQATRQVQAAGHDLLVVQVLHPEERTFPLQGNTRFEGLEGEAGVDLPADAIAAAYRELVEEFTDQVRAACQAVGGRFLPLTVDQPLGEALAAGLYRFYG